MSFNGFFAQDLSLKISSKIKKEITVLKKIDFQKKHKDSISIYFEVNKISNYLKQIGYLTNTIDSISKKNKNFTAYFSLNDKIEKAILKIDSPFYFLVTKYKIKNNTFSIPIEQLQNTLSEISNKLDQDGKSFSKVQLKNISFIHKTLYADIDINQSKKRIINKVILKGYENFPKSYLKNYFNIKPNTIFNQQKIKEISNASKSLTFIKEIKPPEVLFTKDSTLLYMYLKKYQNNSFDGIVNFASKENGGVLFNGNIDLKLNNILNTGEKFNLFWNSIAEERQEFKLSTDIPYIFNSKFSPELSFSIYKQDSTFLNTKFESKLIYNINQRINLAFNYNSESSENLQESLNNNIQTFNNYFVGFKFQYTIPKNDFFFNNKFYLAINPSIGKRRTTNKRSNQFKINATLSYIWDLNKKSSIFIKNRTGYLNSDSFLDNELFRIGGANSLRGFNEQSIFTSSYSFFNLEYRYLTSLKSYFYTITDFGSIKTSLSNENLISTGLGFLFTINKSQINLSSVIGKSSSQNFDFKNNKIIISWKSFF